MHARRTLQVIGAFAIANAPIASHAGTPAPADPTPDGMHFLYEVNRARHDPAAWAHENTLGALLDAFAPAQPLAVNRTLVAASQAKAAEFPQYHYFSHQSPVTGWPNDLLRVVFGYPLSGNSQYFFASSDCAPCLYPSGTNTGVESLATSFGPDGGLFPDPVAAVRGLLGEICVSGMIGSCGTISHRDHLLAAAAQTRYMVESGAAHVVVEEPGPPASTTHYWTFHTGMPVANLASMPRFLTGVVFADADGDDRYDAGEGLGGVTVSANALATTTDAAGGWAIEAPSATYEVHCSGGAFVGTGVASGVGLGAVNRAVDCVSGNPQAWLDFESVPEPGAALAGAVAGCALVAIRARRRRAIADPQ